MPFSWISPIGRAETNLAEHNNDKLYKALSMLVMPLHINGFNFIHNPSGTEFYRGKQ